MSLTGREHFYDAWRELVVGTLSNAPLLDLGTSQPYRKEMSVLRGQVPTPYFCLDVAAAAAGDVVADGHDLPLRGGSVGSIVCSHVLEHVARPDRVISEMHRVLRSGGGAYMTFLDVYPYHASSTYPDYHRFKRTRSSSSSATGRRSPSCVVAASVRWRSTSCRSVSDVPRRQLPTTSTGGRRPRSPACSTLALADKGPRHLDDSVS